MNRKMIVVLGVTLMLMLVVSVAYAQGHTSEQLSDRNWTCVNTGPHNWVHCFPPSVDFPDDLLNGTRSTIQVKVFGVPGDPFLGTELLVHEDIYNWQPCTQDGGEPYEPLGFAPYYACHHFATE